MAWKRPDPPAYDRVVLRLLRLAGFESRRIATAIGRVHYLEARGQGDGPPLLLLHGFSSCAAHLAPILLLLKRHVRRVIVPDFPAHGASDDPPPGAAPELMRAAFFEALEAMLREPVVVFGNSLGGYLAIRFALARPALVRSLILCSPGGAPLDDEQIAALRRTFRLRTHAQAIDFVDRVFARRPPLAHLLAWTVRRRLAKPALRRLLEVDIFKELLQPADLAALEAPVMVIWGRGDRILPEASLEFFRDHLPRAPVIHRPEALGHTPFLERPAWLTRQILDFMRAAGPAMSS